MPGRVHPDGQRGIFIVEQADIFNENLQDESHPFGYDIQYPESDHAPFVASFSNDD